MTLWGPTTAPNLAVALRQREGSVLPDGSRRFTSRLACGTAGFLRCVDRSEQNLGPGHRVAFQHQAPADRRRGKRITAAAQQGGSQHGNQSKTHSPKHARHLEVLPLDGLYTE